MKELILKEIYHLIVSSKHVWLQVEAMHLLHDSYQEYSLLAKPNQHLLFIETPRMKLPEMHKPIVWPLKILTWWKYHKNILHNRKKPEKDRNLLYYWYLMMSSEHPSMLEDMLWMHSAFDHNVLMTSWSHDLVCTQLEKSPNCNSLWPGLNRYKGINTFSNPDHLYQWKTCIISGRQRLKSMQFEFDHQLP